MKRRRHRHTKIGKKSVAGTAFSSMMEEKIKNEEILVGKALEQFEKQKIKKLDDSECARMFYWGETDKFSCGSTSYFNDPNFSFPILPQLIVTPRLIVDIIPLPEPEFSLRYGVTPRQLLKLMDAGLLVPNIYYFYQMGWKDYESHKHLKDILKHPATRINALWISAYLDKRHNFSQVKETSVGWFKKELSKIKPMEAQDIAGALKAGDVPLERIPEICGHKLAYLQTLVKDKSGQIIVDAIQEKWETEGQRHEAAHLLVRAQVLTIGALTGAFGGRQHLAEPLYDMAMDAFERPLLLSAINSPDDLLRGLGLRREHVRQAEFCLHVVDKIDDLQLEPIKDPINNSPVDAFPLEDKLFNKFLKEVLSRNSVQRGLWGRWADDLTTYLQGEGKRPDVEAYIDLWEEIKCNLKYMSLIPDLLEMISTITFAASNIEASGPPTDPYTVGLQFLIGRVGRAANFLAVNLRDREHVTLWKTSVPRPLCRRWLKLK